MTQAPFSKNLADSQTAPSPSLLGSDTAVGPSSASSPLGSFSKVSPFSDRPEGKSRRLAQLLLLTVLPLALIPLAVEGLASYVITQSRSQQAVSAVLTGHTLLASEAISESVVDEFTFMELLAQSPTVTDQLRRGAAKAEADNLPDLPVETLENRFKASRLLNPSQPLNTFLAQAAAAEDFGEIIVTEKNGFTVGYSSPTSDFVQSDEEWWQQSQPQWISDPVVGESTNTYGVELSQRIQAADSGEFLGVMKVLLTAVEFDELTNLLANAGLSGSQQVQIVDTQANLAIITVQPDGETIYNTPEEAQVFSDDKTVSDLATRLVEAKSEDAFPSVEAIQQQLQANFPIQNLNISAFDRANDVAPDASPVEQAAGGRTLVASFVYKGQQYKVATIPNLAWVAIASMDVSEIRAAGRESLLQVGLLALALGAGATVVTIAVSRQLSAPLDDLSQMAQQVAQGNLNVTATLKGSSETRTLANTFNNLVLRIQEFLQEQALSTRQATLAAEITGAEVVASSDLLQVYT
ncbi:MAG: HAMP domain-containing protein, partial [Nodosilinea sp.]